MGEAMKSEPLMVMVPATGPENPTVAFIGASPNKIDAIRRQALCGPAGETFRDAYLSRLGIQKEDALLLHLVPSLVLNEKGRAREPDEQEIQKYRAWVYKTLLDHKPKVVVALGKSTRDVLGDIADTWLPHPVAIRMWGDRGEVSRKLHRVRKMMNSGGEEMRTNVGRRNSLLEQLLKAVDANTEAEMETVFRMPIFDPENGGSSWVEWVYSGPTTRKYTDTMPDGDTYTSVVEEDGQIYLNGAIMRAAVAKAENEELRLVTGVVMEPNEFDTHGDITSIDEVQQAAYGYLYNSQVLGEQHSKVAPTNVKIVESYIAPADFEIEGQNVKKGSWVITAHVLDDEMWEAVKSGKYTGFSIGGFAQKV
jgi:uracil-DNA glycosylase family 4